MNFLLFGNPLFSFCRSFLPFLFLFVVLFQHLVSYRIISLQSCQSHTWSRADVMSWDIYRFNCTWLLFLVSNFIASKFFLGGTEEGITLKLKTTKCVLILRFYSFYLRWLLFSLSVFAHKFWLLLIKIIVIWLFTVINY